MKKLLIVGVTSLILFGVSASASYFWQQKQKHKDEHAAESAEHGEPAHKETSRHGAPSPSNAPGKCRTKASRAPPCVPLTTPAPRKSPA